MLLMRIMMMMLVMIMMMLLVMRIMNQNDADEDFEGHEICQMLVASSSTGILSLGGQH